MQEVQTSPVYTTILGRNPSEPHSDHKQVVVELVLPQLGEHDFKWVFADMVEKTYFHYGFKFHPAGPCVNVHVYGERTVIERLAQSGRPARCELELVEKVIGERKFILVNFYITNPKRLLTHDFGITSKSWKKLVVGEWTTPHMMGMTIGVFPRHVGR